MLDDYVYIQNADGVHDFYLNKDPGLDPFFAPLGDFDVSPTDRSDNARHKMQKSGAWGTRSYLGGQSIHMEGALFGNVPTDYWTARQNLLLALYGVPGANVTEFFRGTIYVKPAGQTEFWGVQFGPVTSSIPIKANMIGSEFLITLGTYQEYWVGGTSGNKYWWS